MQWGKAQMQPTATEGHESNTGVVAPYRCAMSMSISIKHESGSWMKNLPR